MVGKVNKNCVTLAEKVKAMELSCGTLYAEATSAKSLIYQKKDGKVVFGRSDPGLQALYRKGAYVPSKLKENQPKCAGPVGALNKGLSLKGKLKNAGKGKEALARVKNSLARST